jgi:hypothetical protein
MFSCYLYSRPFYDDLTKYGYAKVVEKNKMKVINTLLDYNFTFIMNTISVVSLVNGDISIMLRIMKWNREGSNCYNHRGVLYWI